MKKNSNRSTRRDAISLTKAITFKSVLQLLTPLVLVRLIDTVEFGEYRLFWLTANTATLLLAQNMDRSLLYFLPRSTAEERALWASQTAFYFLSAGLVAGLALLASDLWLPASVSDLTEPPFLLGLFVFFWIASEPVWTLPNADGNVPWQSWAIIAIAILRVVAVIGTAWWTQDIQAVFVGLLAWAVLQWVILAWYLGSRYGWRVRLPQPHRLARQFRYAIPFGISRMFAGSRRQGEQWIVTFLFSPTMLGIFSIGVSFNVILHLVRSSLGNVILPRMSKQHAKGNVMRALDLNNRGNIVVLATVAPVITALWVFAEPAITILYTTEYIAAAPVLRIYLVVLLIMSIELTTVMMIYEQGAFVAKVDGAVLVGGLATSLVGAYFFGFAGVALGALVGEVSSRAIGYRKASRLLKLPVSKLQDWPSLGKIALAIVAAGAVGMIVRPWVEPWSNIYLSVAVGSSLVCIAYLAVLQATGLGWLLMYVLGRGDWTGSLDDRGPG